jgi:hypothetical protein
LEGNIATGLDRSRSFGEKVRAQAFLRDRALCCYTGSMLWLAEPDAVSPQCDHYIPSSQGGPNTLENAISCDWRVNNKRRSKPAPPLLFRAGKITPVGLAHFHHAVPEDIALYLQRMSTLRLSDWNLNEAFENVFRGRNVLLSCDRDAYTRCDSYWSKIALRRLDEWRKRANDAADPPPEERGLAPSDDGDAGSRILWEARHGTTVMQLQDAMEALRRHEEARGGPEISLCPEDLIVLFTTIGRALGLHRAAARGLNDVLAEHAEAVKTIARMIPLLRNGHHVRQCTISDDPSPSDLLRVLKTYVKHQGCTEARASRIIAAIDTNHSPTIHAIVGAYVARH